MASWMLRRGSIVEAVKRILFFVVLVQLFQLLLPAAGPWTTTLPPPTDHDPHASAISGGRSRGPNPSHERQPMSSTNSKSLSHWRRSAEDSVDAVIVDVFPAIGLDRGIMSLLRFPRDIVSALVPDWHLRNTPIYETVCPTTNLPCAWVYSSVPGSYEAGMDFLRSAISKSGKTVSTSNILPVMVAHPDTLNLGCGDETEMHQVIANTHVRDGLVCLLGHEPPNRVANANDTHVGSAVLNYTYPHVDFTAHFATHSDIQLSFFERLPSPSNGYDWFKDSLAIAGVPKPSDAAAKQIPLVSTVTSNCESEDRNGILELLEQRSIDVAHYGRCKRNMEYLRRTRIIEDIFRHQLLDAGFSKDQPVYRCGPEEQAEYAAKVGRQARLHCRYQEFRDRVFNRIAEKMDMISRHPFTLIIENTISAGYVSEKISEALLAGTVPIYMGDAEAIEGLVPTRSVVIVKTARDAVRFLRNQATDETFLEYTAWRRQFVETSNPSVLLGWKDLISPYAVPCKICEYAAKNNSFLRERRQHSALEWDNSLGWKWRANIDVRGPCPRV